MSIKNLSFRNTVILMTVIFVAAVSICIYFNYRQVQRSKAEGILTPVEAPANERDIRFAPTIPVDIGVDDRTVQE